MQVDAPSDQLARGGWGVMVTLGRLQRRLNKFVLIYKLAQSTGFEPTARKKWVATSSGRFARRACDPSVVLNNLIPIYCCVHTAIVVAACDWQDASMGKT